MRAQALGFPDHNTAAAEVQVQVVVPLNEILKFLKAKLILLLGVEKIVPEHKDENISLEVINKTFTIYGFIIVKRHNWKKKKNL